METVTAHEAKQNFGAIVEMALQAPVSITRHGRPSVVVTSDADYKAYMRLKHDALKADVGAGFAQLDRGQFGTRSLEEIKQEGRRRLNAQSKAHGAD